MDITGHKIYNTHWIVTQNDRILNLKYVKSFRCCSSKTHMYQIRITDSDDKDIVIYQDKSEKERDDEFIKIMETLCG